MAKKTPRPGRTLLVFFIAVALLYGAAALGKTAKPALGLDLEGGTRITLTAIGKSPTQNQLNLASEIINERVNGSGVSESDVNTQGGRNIVVEIPGKTRKDLIAAVERTAQLRFRLVAAGSPQPGVPQPTTTPSATPGGKKSTKPGKKSTAKPTGQPSGQPSGGASVGEGAATPKPRAAPFAPLDKKRDKAQGASAKPSKSAAPTAGVSAGPTSGPSSSARPSSVPTTDTPAQQKLIDDPLKWQLNPDPASVAAFAKYTCPAKGQDLAPAADNPDKPLITCDDNQNKYLLSKALIEGTELKTASYGTPQGQVGFAVSLSFKKSGRDAFATATRELAGTGRTFAIVLDGKVLSAPQVTTPILDGNAEITGDFTQTEASSLANSLKYGALPLKFAQPTTELIGPSLAGDQLRAGVLAGIVGLILVMVYCLLYYRGLGLVVITSLIVAGAIIYATVLVLSKTAGFTLTLPGIAGLIVAVGITADSFIVYFERIRDEMRSGKSMRVAVELGWTRARNTCVAADTVSLLAAGVLYVFTIGVVKGFAFTLGISTLIDLVVFFWFTKPMMTSLARVRFFNSGSRYSGLSDETLGVDGPSTPRTGIVGGRA